MKEQILAAIECLRNNEVKKLNDNVFALPNAVVYRQIVDNASNSIIGLNYIEEVLAIKTKSGSILGNSSRLDKLENNYSIREAVKPNELQETLSSIIPMIPFSVFKEAGLDLMSCEIVDAGPEETLKEKREEREKDKNNNWVDLTTIIDRHFTGARLFKAKTKLPTKVSKNWKDIHGEKYFLCDVDRRETQHNIINFFLAELPRKCASISEAYDMLKPEEVKTAEKNGVEVHRQGEFFFVKTDISENNYNPFDLDTKIREIRVGNSRPNRVEEGFRIDNAFYVRGTISHTGREHAYLILPSDVSIWFKVVPNTSKANFQLTGDID